MKSHNQNQRKICLCLLSGLLFFVMSVLSLFSAYAENDSYSLTLHCEAENNQQTKIIANDEFAIVQVADVIIDNIENQDNVYYVTLEKYKADITDWEEISSSQIRDTAKRLSQKVQTEDYLAITTTDSNGNAVFPALQQGVYLVVRTKTVNADCTFEPFIVAVPEIVEGTWIENVVSTPKFEWQKTDIPTQSPTSPTVPAVVPDTPATVPATAIVITTDNDGGYLPQTGQMILPVYLLFTLGVVFVTVGISLYTAGKNDEKE